MLKRLKFSVPRTVFLLVLAILICMISFVSYLCLREKNRIEKNFSSEMDHSTERLTNGLAYPLGILDDMSIIKTIELEMDNKHLNAVLVYSEDGSYGTGLIKDDQGKLKPYKSDLTSLHIMATSTIKQKKKIIIENITIGYVYTYFTDKHMIKERKRQLVSIIIQGLLLTLLGLIVIFAVLQATVLKPLSLYHRLHQLNATKDKLFSIIGHDLRSPLGSISQCLSYLIENKEQFTEEEIDSLLSDTLKTVNNTHKLVDNLIEWARTQKGEIRFNPSELNISDEISQTVSLLNTRARYKNITIKNDVDPRAVVFADPGLFSVITRNLISNGVKFTHPGGVISIGADQKKSHTLITFKDNGIGMSTVEKERLFKIERSFSKRGTKNERGTGLGLILCKEFMDTHKGEIKLDTIQNKGTTFSLLFPSK